MKASPRLDGVWGTRGDELTIVPATYVRRAREQLISKEQIEESGRATAIGGLKGSALGASLTGAGLWLASRRYPQVRSLPPVQKGWIMLVGTLLFGATNAELAYERHMREQWSGPSVELLHQQEAAREQGWENLTMTDKVLRWAKEHRYGIVAASWLGGMAGSAAIIFARNRHTQTFSQKLVQCRMWAQGLTIAVLLASAGLSELKFDGDDEREQRQDPGNAWKAIVAEQEAATRHQKQAQ